MYCEKINNGVDFLENHTTYKGEGKLKINDENL